MAEMITERAQPNVAAGMVIDYCHCGAIASEGHTFSCVLERIKRAGQATLLGIQFPTDTREEASHDR